jgi:hypothetical protein
VLGRKTVALFNFRTRQNQLTSPYFSNNIGFSAPAGENCYEFLVMGKLKGKTEGDYQNRILGLYIEKDAQILSFNSRICSEKRQFTIALQCDLSKCGSNPSELSKLVRNLGFVAAVEYQELRGLMYGRSFPLVFYDSHRALALRSNTLIKLGSRLARDAGTIGTNALFDEGRSYIVDVIEDFKKLLSQSIDLLPLDGYGIDDGENAGAKDTVVQAFCVRCRDMRQIANPTQVMLKNGKPAVQGTCAVCSTRVYRIGFRMMSTLPKIRNSLLLENVQGFLLACGWGTFELRGEIKGKVGSVTVLDPPTFERDVSYGNQFLEGIASGLLEAISMSRYRMALLGQSYDRTSRILTMHFAEQLLDRAQLAIEERPSIPQVSSIPSKLSLIKSGRRINKQAEKKNTSPEEVEIIASTTTDVENELQVSDTLAEVPKSEEKLDAEPATTTEHQQEVENIIQSLKEIAEEARKAMPEATEPPQQSEDEQEKAELLVSVKEKNKTSTNV